MALGMPLAHQGGAVDRVDREVALGAVAVADLFAVVEHRGVVLLALADHHDAAHRHRVDQLAHGVDGCAVAALLVAPADPPAGGHGAGLGDPDQFEGEVSIRGFTAAGRSGMVHDCPRRRRRVPDLGIPAARGAGTSTVRPASEPPARRRPKPAKSRLLQDGRDMFWSMAPLVVVCVVLAGCARHVLVSARPVPADGGVAAYDAPAALQADADALRSRSGSPPSRRLAVQLGKPHGIEGAGRDPVTGQPVRAVSSTVGYLTPSGMYLSLTQSNADEDKLIAPWEQTSSPPARRTSTASRGSSTKAASATGARRSRSGPRRCGARPDRYNLR